MARLAPLTPAGRERLERFHCPTCDVRLVILIGREWAACSCCGVDWAEGDEGGREVVHSRYLPDGGPQCAHYSALGLL